MQNIDWHFPVTVRDVVMMGRLRQLGWFRLPFRRDWQQVQAALERLELVRTRDLDRHRERVHHRDRDHHHPSSREQRGHGRDER